MDIQKVLEAFSEFEAIEKEMKKREKQVINSLKNKSVIHLYARNKSVQFDYIESVEKHTGKKAEIIERADSGFPYEAYVLKDGIRFFTVLSQREYEEYKNSRSPQATKESFDN